VVVPSSRSYGPVRPTLPVPGRIFRHLSGKILDIVYFTAKEEK
jgi:hypothetical protein